MEQIGRHVYNNLKSKKELTKEQKQQIKDYENKTYSLTDEQKEKIAKYKEEIFKIQPENDFKINKNQMWCAFKHNYKRIFLKEFVVNDETINNIMPIFYYFLKDDSFFKCDNLTDLSKPSFEKGLLIVGGYGNGKSSIMQAMRHVLMGSNDSYAFRNTNDVVSDYESCNAPEDKITFWSRITKGRCLFDDVKTEREASNYGKVNIFKDILEKRYLNGNLTHITCNYREGYNDLEDAIGEIGEKYGSRVYDRIFEMFNIIHFTGKSMRK